MPQYALNPSLERVVRVKEHLADLGHRLAHILRQQEDAIIPQFDPNPPHRLVLPLPASTFVTMRVGVLIGEVCYNLRSSLDYLVFALAELDSGIKQKGTQFPIVRIAGRSALGTASKARRSCHMPGPRLIRTDALAS